MKSVNFQIHMNFTAQLKLKIVPTLIEIKSVYLTW